MKMMVCDRPTALEDIDVAPPAGLLAAARRLAPGETEAHALAYALMTLYLLAALLETLDVPSAAAPPVGWDRRAYDRMRGWTDWLLSGVEDSSGLVHRLIITDGEASDRDVETAMSAVAGILWGVSP